MDNGWIMKGGWWIKQDREGRMDNERWPMIMDG
jgi:hypothetical protein